MDGLGRIRGMGMSMGGIGMGSCIGEYFERFPLGWCSRYCNVVVSVIATTPDTTGKHMLTVLSFSHSHEGGSSRYAAGYGSRVPPRAPMPPDSRNYYSRSYRW